ncbi:MAG: hypothetical protein ACLPIX_00010 [Rhodomicrobium sp.]
MNGEDLAKCKSHIGEALSIMEREADTQPEVRLLIALREAMEDIEWLESQGEGHAVRLPDVKHFRVIDGGLARR